MSQWHVGQTGIFRRTIEDDDGPVDLSAATLQEFVYTRPGSKTPISVGTSFTGGTPPGSDGDVEFAVPTTHFDVDGDWAVQFHYISPGDEWWSDVEVFAVASNLKPAL